jgi:hypothetical protein
MTWPLERRPSLRPQPTLVAIEKLLDHGITILEDRCDGLERDPPTTLRYPRIGNRNRLMTAFFKADFVSKSRLENLGSVL